MMNDITVIAVFFAGILSLMFGCSIFSNEITNHLFYGIKFSKQNGIKLLFYFGFAISCFIITYMYA